VQTFTSDLYDCSLIELEGKCRTQIKKKQEKKEYAYAELFGYSSTLLIYLFRADNLT